MGALDGLRRWVAGDLTKRDAALNALQSIVRDRVGTQGAVSVTQETALRHSAVWACIRLRADLISTLPLDVYRRVGGVQVEVAKGPFLTDPAPGVPMNEWLYSSQVDLDRYGNAFGIIASRDGQGLPREVELVDAGCVTVRGKGRAVTGYKVERTEYAPDQVWHERQFTVAGSPLGLNPVAYAAWSIGGYLSAQKFALDFFGSGAAPSGTLRNTEQEIVDAAVTEAAKARFKAATQNRDIFVTGRDWEWTPAVAEAGATAYLEEMKYGAADVCRFFGVPADMIDAGTSSSSVTYANVTQRNLQFLIMNLGPAVIRREQALSGALAQPRYVKLNTDAILRMDPQARSSMLISQVQGRVLAPSEARELDNRPPFTEEQLAEFDRLLPSAKQPATAGGITP